MFDAALDVAPVFSFPGGRDGYDDFVCPFQGHCGCVDVVSVSCFCENTLDCGLTGCGDVPPVVQYPVHSPCGYSGHFGDILDLNLFCHLSFLFFPLVFSGGMRP